MLETIKEYLVSLGFAVDGKSFNQVKKTMDEADHTVTKFAGGAVKNFAIAGVAVASFAAVASVGIAKFLSSLGEAQIENEKLARSMWTTEENAWAYSKTMKALGASLQDLYLSPTLMHQFQTLRQEANSLQTPGDYKEQMQLVQSITFEFKRMKLEASYALQWIGYYLTKYMAGPIRDIKKQLASVNDAIVKDMPKWTKTVAQGLSWLAELGITAYRALKDLGRIADDIGDRIPWNIRLISTALSALALIVATGPIGMLSALFLGLLLLLDDFYTYLDGGESALGPFWAKLQGWIESLKKGIKEFFDEFNNSQALKNFEVAFQNTGEIIKKVIAGAKSEAQELWDELKKQGVLEDLKKSIGDVGTSFSNLLATVTELTNQLLGLKETKTTLSSIGDILNYTIITALQTINELLEGIAGFMDTTSSLLNGSIFNKMEKSGEQAKQSLKDKPDHDIWSWRGMIDSIGEIFTDTGAFNDRMRVAFGKIAQSFDPNNQVPGYLYSSSATHNKGNVTLQQTNNIYGSDPKVTADNAQDNMESMYMRYMQGVFR